MAKLHLMAALAVFPVDVVLIVLVLSNGELIHNNMYDNYPLVSKKGNWKSTENGGFNMEITEGMFLRICCPKRGQTSLLPAQIPSQGQAEAIRRRRTTSVFLWPISH